MRRTLVPIAALFAAGCGYVGDPLPPALNIPLPVPALRAVQIGPKARIGFEIPALTTDAVGIRRVADVELLAGADRVAVEARQPGPAEAEWDVRERVGQRVEFKVRTQSLKGKWSDWSPVAALDIVDPVALPANVKAEPHPEGIRISWNVPEGHSVTIRKKSVDAWTEAATVSGREWIDKTIQPGQQAAFVLEAIHPGGARSEASPEITVVARDIFPPSAPAGLTAVAGIGTIELAWDRSPEPDVAGYRVFRATGDAAPAPAGELTRAASFSDREVKAGLTYRYTVSAVDESGNTSAPSQPVTVQAP